MGYGFVSYWFDLGNNKPYPNYVGSRRLEKSIRENYDGSWENLAKALIRQMKSGSLVSAKKSWLSAHNYMDKNKRGHLNAVIEWSNDSDEFNCKVVWPPFDQDPHQDFAADYYRKAIPVIEIQLMKGAFRLADWLNQLFSECPKLSYDDDSDEDMTDADQEVPDDEYDEDYVPDN